MSESSAITIMLHDCQGEVNILNCDTVLLLLCYTYMNIHRELIIFIIIFHKVFPLLKNFKFKENYLIRSPVQSVFLTCFLCKSFNQ